MARENLSSNPDLTTSGLREFRQNNIPKTSSFTQMGVTVPKSVDTLIHANISTACACSISCIELLCSTNTYCVIYLGQGIWTCIPGYTVVPLQS
jgi:hypothetical protein